MTKRYAVWYGVMFVIALLGGTVPMLLSSRVVETFQIVLAVLVAVVIPLPVLWLVGKLGYPVGKPVSCPRCGTEVPMFRKPASLKQALWGGYQCSNCGAEMDARGRARDTAR